MKFTSTLFDSKILVVDDDESNLRLLERLLEWAGYRNIRLARDGQQALAQFLSFGPDLVLLDLHLPGIDGYTLLSEFRNGDEGTPYLPILVFTADATHEAHERALKLGASDFLTKPGELTEIILRVKNFLHMRYLELNLSERNRDLEAKVRERTKSLEDAQVEMLIRLAIAGEFRDDNTGEHTQRVGDLSAEIASAMGYDKGQIETIRLAARLHDVGKIAVPDRVLSKPGKLTDDEFREMQRHTEVGASMLANSKSPLLQMAERIARSHHERFDGGGYPDGLAGNEIPEEARIVSVADVFDALTHARPYKVAWTLEAALTELHRQSHRQFDPEVLKAFFEVMRAESFLP